MTQCQFIPRCKPIIIRDKRAEELVHLGQTKLLLRLHCERRQHHYPRNRIQASANVACNERSALRVWIDTNSRCARRAQLAGGGAIQATGQKVQLGERTRNRAPSHSANPHRENQSGAGVAAALASRNRAGESPFLFIAVVSLFEGVGYYDRWQLVRSG